MQKEGTCHTGLKMRQDLLEKKKVTWKLRVRQAASGCNQICMGKSRYVENDNRQEGPGGPKWIRIIEKQL